MRTIAHYANGPKMSEREEFDGPPVTRKFPVRMSPAGHVEHVTYEPALVWINDDGTYEAIYGQQVSP